MYPIKITYKDYQNFREGDKNQMVHKIRKAIDEEILHDASSMKQDFRGHLLCFCSSVEEINHLVKHYGEKLNRNVFSVFALHGKISPKDQKRVFEDAGKHKIIFASRIA
jgi:HrpA-like RNA helicase